MEEYNRLVLHCHDCLFYTVTTYAEVCDHPGHQVLRSWGANIKDVRGKEYNSCHLWKNKTT
jgi:hypothetical protein